MTDNGNGIGVGMGMAGMDKVEVPLSTYWKGGGGADSSLVRLISEEGR